MKQVRYSCFETNSSSMHSLIIKKQDNYLTTDELEEELGILRLGRDKWANEENSNKIDLWIHSHDDITFGRTPFKVLTSVKEKLKYYIASECNSKEDIIKVENTLKEIFSNIEEITFASNWFKDWGNGDYDQYGYAQNYGGFKKALIENNIDLKELITNSKYLVIVDGDEYQEFESMKDSGLINFKDIYKIYTWPDGCCDIYEYDSNGNEISHLEPDLD